MRNLKRALSLAMAAAMLLGMMVIGAGAASYNDFTDKDEITHKEAVALLVDLGIIDGTSDTTFSPEQGLQRSAVAKPAYYIHTGESDASMYVGASTKFSDVPGNWAEGFINYCVANGFIAGVSEDKFSPAKPLTAVATAKVMLTVLGYDAEFESFVGDCWELKVMAKAKKAGLMNGLDGLKPADEISRDQACQMVYNTLFANLIENKEARDLNGNKYISESKETEVKLGQQTYGLAKVNGTVTGIVDGKATITNTSPASVTGVKYSNVFAAAPEMVGSTVTFYVKGKVSAGAVAATKMYSSALAVSASNTVASANGVPSTVNVGSVSGDAALTALLETAATKIASLESAGTIAGLKYYYNGSAMAYATAKNYVGKLGVVVEFKDTDPTVNAGVDTVVITEKTAAKLSAAPTLTEKSGKTYTNDSIKNTSTYDFYLDNGKNIVATAVVTEGTSTTNLTVLGAYA